MNSHSDKSTFLNVLKYLFLIFVIISVFIGGWFGLSILSVIDQSPKIDASKIEETMAQTSEILDSEGNLIEKVQTTEYREVVKLSDIPASLCDAFVAVEDERFYVHKGVDPIGIGSAMLDNVSHGRIVRGASTIAQQLARNIYLNDDKTYVRKIKEAYMALQLTEQLGRQGVLEAYMNTVFLGQNAYGVQAAAETYFSKNINDLTIAESAALAGIVKSPTNLALYRTYLPGDVTDDSKIVGDIMINNILYKAVWNDQAIERQHYVLAKMLENEKITEEEYEQALNEDIVSALKPGIKNLDNLSSYYSNIVQNQVVDKLMTELDYTKEAAWSKLVNGGLKIYTVVDRDLQKEVEELYHNFSDIVLKGYSTRVPAMMNWSSDGNGNITNYKDEIIYFKKDNILTVNNLAYIPSSLYQINSDRSITFFSSKKQRVRKVGNYMDIVDYYTVDDNNNLITHKISPISFSSEDIVEDSEGNFTISSDFVKSNDGFYSIDTDGNLIFLSGYYAVDNTGIKQPQSSTVIIENETGYIKAIVGGREIENSGVINRATSVPRQPGSTIKPIAVYTPALDNGYTTATGIDDVPFYNSQGERWPNNWYNGYKGLVSLRESVEQSINVSSVKVLNDIGIQKSKEYLQKFGLIDGINPSNDHYVTSQENPYSNDENLAAMGLGAMTQGLTNLELTAAFNALANKGEYIEPITFSKVIDANGDVILENSQKHQKVVSEQVAYVMTDVLKSSTNHMFSTSARKEGYDIAGKTGTTQNNGDLWFIGYSPYYTIGTWIGFDNQQIYLQKNSGEAVKLWAHINDIALSDKQERKFEEPEGIVYKEVCTISNGIPKKACFSDSRHVVKKELFVEGTEPEDYCDVHYSMRINTVDRRLATDRTPNEELGWGVFIKRPVPYNPSENGYIYPDDWRFTMPGYSSRTYSDYEEDNDLEDTDDESNDDKSNDDENEQNSRQNNNRNNQDNRE